MGPKFNARLNAAYESCRQSLFEEGYDVRILEDFREVEKYLTHSGKDVTPLFQNKFFDFNGCNAFCHVLEKNGQPLTFYSSQLVDTGNMSYLDYHRMQLARIYSGNEVDPSWICPPMKEFSGLLMYSGEALNVRGARTVRSSMKRLALIARMNLYLGLQTWPRMQASVGLARAKHVKLGLGQHYCAYHIYPYATRWIDPPADRRQDDVFLFSLPSDILYQAKIDGLGWEMPRTEQLNSPRQSSRVPELAD